MTCWKMYLWSFEYMKLYMRTAGWRIIWKKIITVMDTTFTVVKRKAWKNSGFFRLFFSQLQKLIFANRTDWIFLLGINSCTFQEVPSTQYPALIHIFKQYYSIYTLCKISIRFIVYRFVSERKRQVVIEQTRFLITVF